MHEQPGPDSGMMAVRHHDPLGDAERIRHLARWILPGWARRAAVRQYWAGRALAEDLQEYTAELVGFLPSHRARLWWYRHVCRAVIGHGSHVHRLCRMYAPFRIVIGDRSTINRGVLLDGRSGLVIGNNVSICEGTVIRTLEHDLDSRDFALRGGRVEIGDFAFVGSYARILPGVSIGEGAAVGVGSVVTHDVAAYAIVAGVPARYMRQRSRDLDYDCSYRKRLG